MNPTTDPSLKSFIETDGDSHFPLQNLPYGAFKKEAAGNNHVGVRIGELVLDLTELETNGFFKACQFLPRGTFGGGSLNALMALGRPAWTEARAMASKLLDARSPELRDNKKLREHLLLAVEKTTPQLPVEIGDYTDFYSSKEHATNVGIMFRGRENALMPNWLHLPVAYHGRASSVVLSGTPVRRPRGQVKPDDSDVPVFSPCRLLDFELEMGFFTGPGNELGFPIPVEHAHKHIFGMVLVNDWSARDIQKWEYQPLGPFNAKNFATSISPWVVTLDALEPFRCPGPEQDPPPLPYLSGGGDRSYDISLEVDLEGENTGGPLTISRSNFKHMYWSISQQLAHHTITGCNVRPGDMMASGTISAPGESGYGSLLELTWKGTKSIQFPNGVERKFLQDGDTLAIRGWCQGDGYRVGFGEVTGRILPALD
jgi:fumarylacetoacetase